MYGDHSRTQEHQALASVDSHLTVRMRDFSLLTSTWMSYISHTFDTMLNRTLHHNNIEVVFKRGLEHLVTTSTPSSQRARSVHMDEVDSNVQARNLAAMLRSHQWQYFVTITCNDS